MTTDRVVQMFDESGVKRDKFSAKPATADGGKNFIVRGMAFSPCSTKLAIAQSDNIVFVYKLGGEWGDKKSMYVLGLSQIQAQRLMRRMEYSLTTTMELGNGVQSASLTTTISAPEDMTVRPDFGPTVYSYKSRSRLTLFLYTRSCNKFLQHHPVSSLVWPAHRPNEIVFATADGKTRVGLLNTNKASTLYTHPEQSMVVSLAASPSGTAVCSGHLDGSVFHFSFSTKICTKITTHTCAPYGLGFGVGAVSHENKHQSGGTSGASETIVCAGADRKIIFYETKPDGAKAKQVFDHGATETDAREFSCAKFDAAGETCAVGSFDAFFLYSKDPRRGTWRLVTSKKVPNLYTVSALEWRFDSGRLAVGGLRGNVDLYDGTRVGLSQIRHTARFTSNAGECCPHIATYSSCEGTGITGCRLSARNYLVATYITYALFYRSW